MEELRLKLLSIWVWSAASGIIMGNTALTALAYVLTMGFDPRRAIAGRVFRNGARWVAMAHPAWRHAISGNLPPDVSHGYVIVSNHESHADSVLISHLGFSARWLAKEELMKIPFLGWMMRMANDIPVKRGDKDSGKVAMEEMARHVKGGGSVVLFPEGTRSTTGELGAFKDGAFKLAIETQAPVLPLVLTGCGATLPKGGWVLGRTRSFARLHVMAPIHTTGLTVDDVPAFRERVRTLMMAEHARLVDEVKAELAS
jgi:1-acyl-sn-glycerol-3-phosphate acyltransferase